MVKKTNQEQAQLLETIGYFKAMKDRAPKHNPKIVESIDMVISNRQDDLYELLKGKGQKPMENKA